MICCSVLGLRYRPLINNHNARWSEIWDDGETEISRGETGVGVKFPSYTATQRARLLVGKESGKGNRWSFLRVEE